MDPTDTAPPGAHADAALRFAKEVVMSTDAERLLAETLRLTRSERAEFAAKLLASLDEAPDAAAQEAWSREIARRAEEARTGSQPGLSRDEFDELVRRLRS